MSGSESLGPWLLSAVALPMSASLPSSLLRLVSLVLGTGGSVTLRDGKQTSFGVEVRGESRNDCLGEMATFDHIIGRFALAFDQYKGVT